MFCSNWSSSRSSHSVWIRLFQTCNVARILLYVLLYDVKLDYMKKTKIYDYWLYIQNGEFCYSLSHSVPCGHAENSFFVPDVHIRTHTLTLGKKCCEFHLKLLRLTHAMPSRNSTDQWKCIGAIFTHW